MFNQDKFSDLLSKINSTYDTMTDFAKKASFDRTYISKYINKKLPNPPTPKILEKIANASHGLTTYSELMDICGYLSTINISDLLKSNNITKDIEDSAKETGIVQFDLDLHTEDFSEEEEKILANFISKWEKNEKVDINTLIKDCSDSSKKRILREYNKLYSNFILLFEKKSQQDKIKQEKNINQNKMAYIYMCPVYGQISAGQPNWVEENIEGRLPLDSDLMGIVNPEDHFFLRVNGESMNKIIKNGAFALIHKQDYINNGEIAVVLVNGFDATLKKFTKQGDFVVLEPQSTDDSFETQIYDKKTSIKILGKYIGKMEINK